MILFRGSAKDGQMLAKAPSLLDFVRVFMGQNCRRQDAYIFEPGDTKWDERFVAIVEPEPGNLVRVTTAYTEPGGHLIETPIQCEGA